MLLLLVQIGLANTEGTEGKKDDSQQQTGKQVGQQEKLDQEPSTDTDNEAQMDQDSVEDDSVSKYNFIFHFLYKFKYDHEDAL